MSDEPDPQSKINIDLLIDDLAHWAHNARLRGFTPREVVSALGAAGLSAMQEAGINLQAMHEIVDHHYSGGWSTVDRAAVLSPEAKA